MPALRDRIRSYEIACHCWEKGTRPGFRVVGNPPYLQYDGVRELGHFTDCEWVKAVNQVYEEERASEQS